VRRSAPVSTGAAHDGVGPIGMPPAVSVPGTPTQRIAFPRMSETALACTCTRPSRARREQRPAARHRVRRLDSQQRMQRERVLTTTFPSHRQSASRSTSSPRNFAISRTRRSASAVLDRPPPEKIRGCASIRHTSSQARSAVTPESGYTDDWCGASDGSACDQHAWLRGGVLLRTGSLYETPRNCRDRAELSTPSETSNLL
jgi:hypothetical protein